MRYPEAAQRFAEAAAKVPQGHEDEGWKYLNAEADALYREGDEFGDNAAAALAIERYRHLAELRPRNAFPRDWARTQVSLGLALETLGERESGRRGWRRPSPPIAKPCRNILARAPLDWARTQINLGNSLKVLGERESGTARLEEAAAAFREALQEYTRARMPLDWAATQMNLGNALERLDERESGTARLEEAAAAYREALQEATRARVPLRWAMTQMNLGTALATLGERESGTARLEESAAAFREALQEYTRARVPLRWAMTQGHCAQGAWRAGERDGTTRGGRFRLSRSLAGRYPRVPLEWAMTKMNLGDALLRLGERESGTARLNEAAAAYRDALKEYTRARVPLYWAATQYSRARAAPMGHDSGESRL